MPSVRTSHERVIPPQAHGAVGFSLVELMVAVVISLIGTLAMMAAFARFEGQKRTTTSGDDAQQAGLFSLYEMERQLRTAGSGLIQGRRAGVSIWGCAISARAGGANVLPLPAALAAPFDRVPLGVRALPLVVYAGGSPSGSGLAAGGTAAPDVIAVISGNPAVRTFNAKIALATVNGVRLRDSVFGFYADEYLLAGSGGNDCSLGVIDAAPNMAANEFMLRAAQSPATGFQGRSYLYDFGTRPAFSLFGVDAATSRLVMFDLLRREGEAPVEIADGIVMVKAAYGIDDGSAGGTAGDRIVDRWVLPVAPDWDAATLTDGSAASAQAMTRIMGLRLAVVARSQLDERAQDYTGPGELTLFDDVAALTLRVSVDPRFRYKVYETTIPIHNQAVEKIL